MTFFVYNLGLTKYFVNIFFHNLVSSYKCCFEILGKTAFLVYKLVLTQLFKIIFSISYFGKFS